MIDFPRFLYFYILYFLSGGYKIHADFIFVEFRIFHLTRKRKSGKIYDAVMDADIFI